MLPDWIIEILKQYGLAGIIMFGEALALRTVFAKYESSQQARIDDGKLYAGALKEAAKAIEKSNETIVDLAAEVSRLKLIYEHSRGGS